MNSFNQDDKIPDVDPTQDRISKLEDAVSNLTLLLEKVVEQKAPTPPQDVQPAPIDPFDQLGLTSGAAASEVSSVSDQILITQVSIPRFTQGPASLDESDIFSAFTRYTRERNAKPTIESIFASFGRVASLLAFDPRFSEAAQLYRQWAARLQTTPTTTAQLQAHVDRAAHDYKTLWVIMSHAFNSSRTLARRLELYKTRLKDSYPRTMGSPPARLAMLGDQSNQLATWLQLDLVQSKVIAGCFKTIAASVLPRRAACVISDCYTITKPRSVHELIAITQSELARLEESADTLGMSIWAAKTAQTPVTTTIVAQTQSGNNSSDTTTSNTSSTSTGRRRQKRLTPAIKSADDSTIDEATSKKLNKWNDPSADPPHEGMVFCTKHNRWGNHATDKCNLPDDDTSRTRSGKPYNAKPEDRSDQDKPGEEKKGRAIGDHPDLTPLNYTVEGDERSHKTVPTLLDTGAEVCWMRRSVAAMLNLDVAPTTMSLAAANNTVTPAVGAVTVTVSQADETAVPREVRQTITAYVMDDGDLSDPVILSAEVSERFSRAPIALLDPEDLDEEAFMPQLATDELYKERLPSLDKTIPELKEPIMKLLDKHHALFEPLSETPADVKPMTVDVDPDAKPVVAKPYWLSRALKHEVEATVRKLLAAGIIEECDSNWASPLFFVRQGPKNRMVIDYRAVNAVTPATPVPLTACNDLLSMLKGMKIFASIDLLSGYHQIAMAPEHRHLTAFVCHIGVYQFRRVPFGLRNAPSHFQTSMMNVLSGLTFKACLLYVDDILVFGATPEEFLVNLDEVLTRLGKHGLKLGASKCSLGVSQALFLGYLVSAQGLSIDPSRIAPLKQLKIPSTLTEVRSALGLFNFYRRFLSDYATIAEPLIALTRKHTGFEWTPDCTSAFETLLASLVAAPVLANVDYEKELFIRSDASGVAIGAVLMQGPPGKPDETVAFFSTTLTAAQRRWSINEKEAFALTRAVEHFDAYVRGHSFTCEVDHRNLTFTATTSASPKIERWRHRLSEYDMVVQYLPGEDNSVADALSRVGQARTVAPCRVAVATLSTRSSNSANIIAVAHGSALTGHCGRDETTRLFRDAGYTWPGLATEVAEHVKACPVCQKVRLKSAMSYHTGHLSTSTPFDTVYIDSIGPLNPTPDGFSHIIVMVDSFTRWAELVPTVTTNARSAADAIIERVVCRHGIPRRIHSDDERPPIPEQPHQRFD